MSKINLEHLEITPLKDRTPEWLKFRERGLGGSEIGTVLGLESALKYKSLMRLYNEKIGRIKPYVKLNEAIDNGIEDEGKIRRNWEFWEPEKGYIDNKEIGRKMRSCGQIVGYAVDPKYPHLFASIDGYISPEDFGLEGQILPDGGIVEIKTTENTASQHWDQAYPFTFVAQIHHYMLIHRLDYGELFIQKNGRYLSGHPIYRDERLIERIIQKSSSFWYGRVVPGKEAFKQAQLCLRKGDEAGYEKYIAIVDELEPEPDGYADSTTILNEKAANNNEEQKGDEKNLHRLVTLKNLKEVSKQVDFTITQVEQMVKKDMNDLNVDRLTYDSGHVSFKKSPKQKSPVFLNKIKTDVDKDRLEILYKNLLTEL